MLHSHSLMMRAERNASLKFIDACSNTQRSADLIELCNALPVH